VEKVPFIFKKQFVCLALTAAFIADIGAMAHAQIVNSGPGTSSSNSQVTLTATLPSVITVRVDNATSILTHTINPNSIDAASNTVAADFQIRGDVIVNSPSANVQCSLNALNLNLSNGTDTITANLTGTIGGVPVSTTPFRPTFTAKRAAIMINGDIVDTTVTSAKAPGNYSGTLTITATLL
jgi:methionine-rich copper-binding protein CopC